MDALMAFAVLCIGSMFVAELVTLLRKANVDASFNTSAFNLLGTFSSEVRAASCDVVAPGGPGTLIPFSAATSDPGLVANSPAFYAAPVPQTTGAATTIQHVGVFDQIGTPRMQLRYSVNRTPPIADQPPSLDVTVQIRRLTGDAAADARSHPVNLKTFTIHKVCTVRTESSVACGGGLCGRGEFY